MRNIEKFNIVVPDIFTILKIRSCYVGTASTSDNEVDTDMTKDTLTKMRRSVAVAYVFMFLALFSIVGGIFAYWFARKVTQVDYAEVWLQAQALWIMRNIVIYMMLAIFAALWFIPLFFFAWDSQLWVKGCTVIGVVFSCVAFIFLLNAWFKGIHKFFQNKAVF